MIRFFLIICLLLFCNNSFSKDFIVYGSIDLKGKTINLENGDNLVFFKNSHLLNGNVRGNNSSIVLQGRDECNLMKEVTLEGTWHGYASDLMFYQSNKSKSDFNIVSSLMKFEDVVFQRKKYYLEKWKTIIMNSGNVSIRGNNVIFFLTGDKGNFDKTDWGNRYTICNLFVSKRQSNSNFYISDVNIIDNSSIVKGWGENLNKERSVLYYYFCPGQTSIIMENVNCDGAGALIHTYRVNENSDKIIIRSCNVRTTNFAIELGNRKQSHTHKIVIENCDIFRYLNASFVGPISIVGSENQADTVIIKGNHFSEEKAGNIELSGVKVVIFENNTTENVFCYSGNIVPDKYICRNNKIELRSIKLNNFSNSLKIAGKEILIEGNSFLITERPFPFITLIYPEAVKKMIIRDNFINYTPNSNPKSFCCLFSFRDVKGHFSMYNNTFKSKYKTPYFRNYLPEKFNRFEDPFKGKVKNF